MDNSVIYKNFYLYNEDSLSVFFNVIQQFKKDKIIIVTDPPFNIGYSYNTYKDKKDEDEYYNMLSFFFSSFPCVVIHYPEALYKLAFEIGKFPEKVITWVYNSNTARQHRDIAFFDVIPDFSQVRQPYKNPNDKRIKQRIANGAGGQSFMIGGKLIKLKTQVKKKLITPAKCRKRLWKEL